MIGAVCDRGTLEWTDYFHHTRRNVRGGHVFPSLLAWRCYAAVTLAELTGLGFDCSSGRV